MFALDQNHAMRVLRMPNGVAAVQTGAGDQPEAVFLSLGGNFISSPAVVAHTATSPLPGMAPQEVIEVFGIQADRAMYTCTTNRTPLGDYYLGWTSLGGIFTSAPTAVSGGLGQVDVFARDANFQLAHRSWNGRKWSDWENLGGTLVSAPIAVSWGPNRIDVFALSNDGSVGHTWWDGQIWNQWQPLVPPGPSTSLVGTPSAITWGQERLDVFVSGNDGNLYHYTQTAGAFGTPESLGTPAALPLAYASPSAWTPSPTAIAVATNHLVALGLANQWNHEEEPITPVAGYRIWDGATWRGWAQLDSCGHPSRYRFSVDYVTCQTPRALIDDSDTATASITAGNGQMQSVSQKLGTLGGSQQVQTNLLFFEPVPVELCEPAIFSHQVINSSANEPQDINTALEKVAADLAQYALKQIEGDLGSLNAITSITVATSVVPVVGTILTLLGQWVLSELPGAVVAGTCDGMVALEQDVLLGTDIDLATAGGKVHSVTTEHPGTTSANGCGPNSQYQVQWSIRQV